MNSKHHPGQESIDRVNAHIVAMCARQGVTLSQLYKIVPEVAARRKINGGGKA